MKQWDIEFLDASRADLPGYTVKIACRTGSCSAVYTTAEFERAIQFVIDFLVAGAQSACSS